LPDPAPTSSGEGSSATLLKRANTRTHLRVSGLKDSSGAVGTCG